MISVGADPTLDGDLLPIIEGNWAGSAGGAIYATGDVPIAISNILVDDSPATDPDYLDPDGLGNGFPNFRLSGLVGKGACGIGSVAQDLDGTSRPTPAVNPWSTEPGAFEVTAP